MTLVSPVSMSKEERRRAYVQLLGLRKFCEWVYHINRGESTWDNRPADVILPGDFEGDPNLLVLPDLDPRHTAAPRREQRVYENRAFFQKILELNARMQTLRS